MSVTTLPPFPSIPTVSFDFLKADDPSKIDCLWQAATSIRFWYLKNHDTDKDVDGMFDLGAESMALPPRREDEVRANRRRAVV